MLNYKSIALPIIAVLALAYETFTGHKISTATQDAVANIIGSVGTLVSIWGIYHNHKK